MGGRQSKPRLYNEPLGKRQIRLLSIDRSDPASQTISCRLTTYNLDDAPPYHALSYVWGDPTVTSSVTINGISVEKPTNLVAALHRLRQLDEADYWIDAICIDQQNNGEKSNQVRLMAEIFSKAVETTAWLGPGIEDSELAMTFLDQWTTAGIRLHDRWTQIREALSARTEEERERMMLAYERTSAMRDLIRDVLVPPRRTVVKVDYTKTTLEVYRDFVL
ncbi:hypothetical protein NKR19_g10226 [Coniochaeta hoffmannii]|uniref:Heterokaryon incompatibility domain-containing protein n=1 Tax=Coniochaeta hoffmannii TaxID=91930 RepID=A0AA38RE45_9PEZI|nr:hypothetical protein NKR19_g10226 [Coniochaeta hoffmannii]